MKKWQEERNYRRIYNEAILAPVGLQDHAHSEEICYTSSATFSDEELINMIRYAKSKRCV